MKFSYNFKISILYYTFLAIVGASFIFIPTESLLNFIFSTIGILIVLFNIFPCVTCIDAAIKNKDYILPAIGYSLVVLLGLMFIFGWELVIVSIMFSISLIVMPIIRIIKSKTKLNTLKKEVPYIAVGILLFFIPFTNVLGIIFKVFGVLVIIYSIVMIVLMIINRHKNNNTKQTNNSDIIIDAKIKEL